MFLNLVLLLDHYFYKGCSLKDSQGRTCDEILVENLKCKIDKYEN